ncbi:MAG: DUF2779 domain-containing protein [Anaerolineales bacterium]
MTLTKSDFLLYLDTPLHLWAQKNNRIEKEPSRYDLFLMKQGEEIGKLAKDFLQDTLHSSRPHYEIAIEKGYSDDRYEARADVVVFDPDENAYDLYEIKSATSVKKANLYDAAFQSLVCEANVPLRKVYIVHTNKDYIRQGEIDPNELFTIEDVSAQVDELKDEVKKTREDAWQVAKSKSPKNVPECVKPDHCPCPNLCHPELPEHSIYDLSRLNKEKARDLKAKGILAVEDIPPDYKLSERQRKQVEAVKWGKPFLDIQAIKNELAKLEYPLYFLDYETFNPGLPAYDGYHPFQHMVFQYSLHVLDTSESKPKHYEFLFTGSSDPGIEVVEDLAKHIGERGSVVVWYKFFETKRNEEMAERYPEYRSFLLDINERVYDLMEVFSKGYYIHPGFHGSSSIKKVSPILVKDVELHYNDLDISCGDNAMIAWHEITSGVLSNEEVEAVEQYLLHYCKMDTMAMVKIWEALKKLR